ncbi:MAG: hypothetical protein ABIJ94_02765 [candidate division WOR-3 bacterium]
MEEIVAGELSHLYDKFKNEINKITGLLLRLGLQDKNAADELQNIIKTTLPKALDELINHIASNLKIEASFSGFSEFAGDIGAVFRISNLQIKKTQSGNDIIFSLEGAGTISSNDKVQWIIKYKGKVYDFDVLNPKLNLAQNDFLENLFAAMSLPPMPPLPPTPPSNGDDNSSGGNNNDNIDDISAQAAVIKADNQSPIMIASTSPLPSDPSTPRTPSEPGTPNMPSTPSTPITPGAPGTSPVELDEDCKSGILENGGLVPCRGTPGCPCTFCHFFYLIQKIINFITLKFVPTVAILLVIIGGAFYLFNFGNTNNVKKGTDILIGVAVGILIIYGAWIIINTLLIKFVRGDVLENFPENWFTIKCPIK